MKLKSNHKGNFTNPAKLAVNGGFITKRFLSRYNFINDNNASFAEYFLKFYRKPFNNLSATSHGRMDAVIRFESISQDFKDVRKIIGLDSSEELVRINMTAQKNGYEQYYLDEAVVQRAVYVFGPFMEKWGYPFPKSFGSRSVSAISRVHFYLLIPLKELHVRLRGVL